MLLKRGTVAKPYRRSEVWAVIRLTVRSEVRKVENRIECGYGGRTRQDVWSEGVLAHRTIQS